MKKVLWLASWYPNESDPYSGDFIKRQAEAVSVYQPLKVVFAGKRPSVIKNRMENINGNFPNLKEHILYYTSSQQKSIFSLTVVCHFLF